MEKQNSFIDFYSESEISIMGLKRLLEPLGIFGIIQNDFNSGMLAGFMGGTPDTIRFKIRKSDIEKAKPILEEYINLKVD